MMNDTHNNQKPPSNKQGKNFTSSERLGTCSMIAGIIGIVCSLFYLPMSLAYNQTAIPTGLVCGVIGILLALMARNADMSPRKAFNARAIAGLVLSVIAITLTFFFFYALASYYEALSDPVTGPQINEFINRLQEQLNQQMQLPKTTGFIWFSACSVPIGAGFHSIAAGSPFVHPAQRGQSGSRSTPLTTSI